MRSNILEMLLRWARLLAGPAATMAIMMLSLSSVRAETVLPGGVLSSNLTLQAQNGPYRMSADTTVLPGVTMTLEAGAVIKLDPGVNLTIQGKLLAQGTAQQPVVITSSQSSPARGDWGKVAFTAQSTGSTLAHALIEYGHGLDIKGTAVTLDHCTLRYQSGAAIVSDLGAMLAGTGNLATDNDLNGIDIPAGEIVGNVRWRLQGIPYVVRQGSISIGSPPRIAGVTPHQVMQGRSVDAEVTGTRLLGLTQWQSDDGSIAIIPRAASTATSQLITIAADRYASTGMHVVQAMADAGAVVSGVAIEVLPYLPDLKVDGIVPDRLARGGSATFTVSGSGLSGASLTLDSKLPQFTLSGVSTSDTGIQFTLAATSDAQLGAQTLTLANPSNAVGTAQVSVLIEKGLPALVALPSPMTVPVDNLPHAIKVGLSEVAEKEYLLTLSVADTATATVSTSQVIIPAGGQHATVEITGKKRGQTQLAIASEGLAGLVVPVTVQSDFSSLHTNHVSRVQGVVRDAP